MRGLCECGCGNAAPLSQRTSKRRGIVKGQPLRYIAGHHARAIGARWVEEDRGFDTPCWIWQLSQNAGGYGTINRRSSASQQNAHRVVYEDLRGPLPKHLHLDHLCCVRSCVNPEHMEPVSPAENVRRGAKAKLSWPEVREIRQRVAAGETQASLASEFGIASATACEIVHHRRWCEEPDDE